MGDSEASKTLANSLVEAAVIGLTKLKNRSTDVPSAQGDLRCAQCQSSLFEPTTLEDGVTVCRPCVRQYRENLRKREDASAVVLPTWAGTPDSIGFGAGTNVVLAELTQRCCPHAYEAAATRQRANSVFGNGRFADAVEAYSSAIKMSPFADAVLHCNRSIARLKVGDITGAVEDAAFAVSLTSASALGGPMWVKAWFRLAQAFLATSQTIEASFAFAMSASATPAKQPWPQHAQALKSAIPGYEASGGQSCTAQGSTVAEDLKAWLMDGHCPSIAQLLPAVGSDGGATFQLGLGGAGSEQNPEHMKWIRDQLECALCLGLLWEPTTIPCGHTLCRPCVARTLDHAFDTQPACPMCRKDLSPYLGWLNARAVAAGRSDGLVGGHGGAQIPVNHNIDNILQRHFPTETAERAEQIQKAEAAAGDGSEDNLVIPIFICSMAMPSVACPLHIFEPRYRLMMRRCIESGQRQFGMCLCPDAEYGTMLRILQYEQLPDGRSRIKTIGSRRFQVLEWGMKDGYSTGRIRWVDDVEEQDDKETTVDQESKVTAALDEAEEQGREGEPACKAARPLKRVVSPAAIQLQRITDGLLGHVLASADARSQLEQQLGPQPEVDGRDGPHCPGFVFWCAGLSGMPPRRAYELCFGDECRQCPSKRLEVVLAHFKRKLDASGQGGPPADEHDSDDDGSVT